MRVGRRGEREVTLIHFRIACLLERAQHQIGKNAFLRFPGDFLCQLLVHARGDVDVLGNLVQPRIASTAVTLASFASCTILRSKTAKPETLDVPEMLRPFLRAWWERAGRPIAGPIFPVRKGRSRLRGSSLHPPPIQ